MEDFNEIESALIEELRRCFRPLPFGVWLNACKRARATLLSRFPKFKLPDLRETSACFRYAQYCKSAENIFVEFLDLLILSNPGNESDIYSYRVKRGSHEVENDQRYRNSIEEKGYYCSQKRCEVQPFVRNPFDQDPDRLGSTSYLKCGKPPSSDKEARSGSGHGPLTYFRRPSLQAYKTSPVPYVKEHNRAYCYERGCSETTSETESTHQTCYDKPQPADLPTVAESPSSPSTYDKGLPHKTVLAPHQTGTLYSEDQPSDGADNSVAKSWKRTSGEVDWKLRKILFDEKASQRTIKQSSRPGFVVIAEKSTSGGVKDPRKCPLACPKAISKIPSPKPGLIRTSDVSNIRSTGDNNNNEQHRTQTGPSTMSALKRKLQAEVLRSPVKSDKYARTTNYPGSSRPRHSRHLDTNGPRRGRLSPS